MAQTSFNNLIERYKTAGKEELVPELEALKGSYSTLSYNHTDIMMEYTDHIQYRTEEISELESGPLPVFQYKLHNYIASSYSFTENINTALSGLDSSLRETYESRYYGTPVEKSMRGLRTYAQHHRVLPLEINRVESQNEYPDLHDPDYKNEIMIDLDTLVTSKRDWDEDTRRYFFESDNLEFIGEDMKMNTYDAVGTHFSFSSGLRNWLLNSLSKRI